LDFTRSPDLSKDSIQIDKWLDSVIAEQEIPNYIHVNKILSLNNVEVSIDASRMRRVIFNVMDNAYHAIFDKYQQDKSENAQLTLETIDKGSRFEICLSDSVTGIAKPVLSRIFEPLFSTKGFGVGLGMSAVKKIMDLHDGGIDVETKEGKGTTITLWLPNVSSSKRGGEKAA